MEKDQKLKAVFNNKGSLRKPPRGTLPNKRLTRRTITVYVRYKSFFISFSSTAKQEREMSTTANFSYFHLELNAAIAYLAWARLWSNWRTEQIRQSRISYFTGKI